MRAALFFLAACGHEPPASSTPRPPRMELVEESFFGPDIWRDVVTGRLCYLPGSSKGGIWCEERPSDPPREPQAPTDIAGDTCP